MSKHNVPFSWADWQSGLYPSLEDHSATKLQILAEYIEAYILTLFGTHFGPTSFKLDFVDGFAGGGIYSEGEKGSPFVLLEAVKLAEAKLNQSRKNPVKLETRFFFVEQSETGAACLSFQLKQAFPAEVGRSIFVIPGEFGSEWPRIVQEIKTRQRKGGRVIFFLDQCGYSKVSALTIAKISEALSEKAEFIINIAISWFLDRIKDDVASRNFFKRLGIGNDSVCDQLLKLKGERGVDWRFLVESEVGRAFRNASRAAFWSPFFIRPRRNHRGYWLLHLAPNATARKVMAEVQWKHGCSFAHYGRKGLRMLAYDPESDRQCYIDGFSFDSTVRAESKTELTHELSAQIRDRFPEGIPIRELYSLNCNDSIADFSLFCDALNDAQGLGEVKILGSKGGKKRGSLPKENDIVRPNYQLVMPLFFKPRESF